ncbi:MAG TPA: hypothetical protein VEW03_02335 [Longimicrobiaceae bacterium]|nr:hypothetical protein [Longimicrobiaceae bacterium]
MRYAYLLVTASALAGCTSAIAGSDGDPQLEFTVREMTAGNYMPAPVVTATGGDGEIVVQAELSAPDPCQRVRAELDGEGKSLRLDVYIERVGEACVAVIGNFGYTGRVHGLPAGSYTLAVRHTYPGTGWPGGTVHTTTVNVD